MADCAGKPRGMKGDANRATIRIAAASALALSLAACSAMPDAVRPGFIYGSEDPAKATVKSDGFPNLADVPDQAPVGTTPAEKQLIASNLSTDRSQSQAGDVALRSGSGEAIVQSGAAPEGAAEHGMEIPADIPPPPTMAPTPRSMPDTIPVSEAPAGGKQQVAALPPALEPVPAPSAPVEMPAAVAEPAAPAVEQAPRANAAEPVRPTAVERTGNLSPSLTAGTEAAPVPAPVAAAEPRLAAVEPTPALAPPPKAVAQAGGIIPFPTRGGHARLADIKGGIKLTDVGQTGPRAEVVSEEDEASGARVTAAPTTPVEVQPVGE
jgi:hypothetical protein